MKLELIKDNTQERPPINPMTTYEIMADMGEDGTKTVYECGDFSALMEVFSQIQKGNFNIPNVDLDETEIENLKGISINLCLTAKTLDLITMGTEQTAVAELMTYKVEPETNNFVNGLCPRSWENTDISKLSELQINGILDNCEKCQRYSQCQKVTELNDKLKELNNEVEIDLIITNSSDTFNVNLESQIDSFISDETGLSENQIDEIRRKMRAIAYNLDVIKKQAVKESKTPEEIADSQEIKKVRRIELCKDVAYDEFYLSYGNGLVSTTELLPSSCCHLEVVTKDVAKSNDLERISGTPSISLKERDTYRVGEVLSDYTKLGDTPYYFRFM